MFGNHKSDCKFTSFFVQARSCQWFIDSSENVHQDVLPQMALRSHLQESHKDSEKHSDIGDSVSLANDDAHNQHSQHPVDSNALLDFPKIFPHELTSQERETAISRYKEKRKTRRYCLQSFVQLSVLWLSVHHLQQFNVFWFSESF